MATQSLQHESVAATASDLTDKLTIMACKAGQLEQVIANAAAVLSAIDHGDLLTALPATDDPMDSDRHNAAVALLRMLNDQLRGLEALPGTDLSISLHVMASDSKKGRLRAN